MSLNSFSSLLISLLFKGLNLPHRRNPSTNRRFRGDLGLPWYRARRIVRGVSEPP